MWKVVYGKCFPTKLKEAVLKSYAKSAIMYVSEIWNPKK